MIKAEIIADSVNPKGNRCTTFILEFPRIILAELNTHRVLSRNSASSRAIPYKTMLKRIRKTPFIPIAWQKDHKGMQGTEYFEGWRARLRTQIWLFGKTLAVIASYILNKSGVTKQLCNRILEPFMYHRAIVTATELENFFKLRCPQYEWNGKFYRSKRDLMGIPHRMFNFTTPSGEVLKYPQVFQDERFWQCINKGAGEIHIMALAEAMWDEYNDSTPKLLKPLEWHIPFGDKIDQDRLQEAWKGIWDDKKFTSGGLQMMIQIATARCARVSYLNYEGKDDYLADIKLHNILSKMGHWSPFEHCAQSTNSTKYSGNFKGFIQYRKTFEGESGNLLNYSPKPENN